MTTLRLAQSGFGLGEFSPLMAGRSDLAQYRNGAARLLNRRLLAQGGTDTRPGTRFVAAAGPDARLIPYMFSQAQRYLLVLRDGGLNAFVPPGTPATGFTGAPWTAAHLRDVRFAQSADTLLLFHPAWTPQRVRRTGPTTFTRDIMPVEWFPFYRFEDPAVTMLPSAGAGAVTLTFSAPIWTAAVVGEQVEYKGRRIAVTGFTSAAELAGTWVDTSTGLTVDASIEWKEQAWSGRKGWPICGTFMDGRLWVGGTDLLPNMVWGSKAGAFFNFGLGTNDADGIAETATGVQSGRIQHLFPAARLIVMTDTACFGVIGGNTGAITPKNIAIRRAAEVGASRVPPAEVDSATTFVDRTGAVLREIEIDESRNLFTANPVSLLAAHLVRGPVAMTVLRGNANRPEVYAVLVNADGTIATYHSLRQERVTAFTPWETEGAFRDACAVGDDLYALTERAGAWRIERFDDAAAALDCTARATSGTRTRTFGGFAHLAGRTVGVSCRGHDLGDATVSGAGTITLTDRQPAVFEVEAGFRYAQVIRPMPADVDLPAGPGRGLKKRLLQVDLVVDRAGQLRVNGRDVLLDFGGDDFDTPPATRTGVIRKKMTGVSIEAQFDVTVATADKVTVLAMTRHVAMET